MAGLYPKPGRSQQRVNEERDWGLGIGDWGIRFLISESGAGACRVIRAGSGWNCGTACVPPGRRDLTETGRHCAAPSAFALGLQAVLGDDLVL